MVPKYVGYVFGVSVGLVMNGEHWKVFTTNNVPINSFRHTFPGLLWFLK